MSTGLKSIREKSKAIRATAETEEYGRTMLLDINMLVEDPDNKGVYGDYDTEGLSESIKENGFKGRIYAYPVENGKYMIESGHRTREAAVKAGLTSVPVVITAPPANDLERRKRLILSNLHGRQYTPMMLSRQAEYLYDTYKAEASYQSDKGDSKANQKILEKVAADMEISISTLSRYRLLKRLTPELQKLVDCGVYSWAEIAQAAHLETEQQDMFYDHICAKAREDGQEAINGKWIKNEIEACKTSAGAAPAIKSDPIHDTDNESNQNKKRPSGRRINGCKAVLRAKDAVQIALSEDALIKPQDREITRSALIELRETIDSYLADTAE